MLLLPPTLHRLRLETYLQFHPWFLLYGSYKAWKLDHDIVLFNIRYKYSGTSRLPLKLYQYYKADFDKLRRDVSKGASEFFTCCVHSHVEDNWSFFKTIWTVAVDKHVPSKMSSSRISLPSIIRSIKRQMGKRDRLLKKSKAHGWQTLTSVAWISLPKKQSGEIT